jgi:hypothetical protein
MCELVILITKRNSPRSALGATSCAMTPLVILFQTVLQPSHTKHNTSPKYEGHEQGENAIIYLQVSKTYITSIQDQVR